MDFETRDFYACSWGALVRLARFMGLSVRDAPETLERRVAIAAELRRRLP